ncbi:hypothetical protein CPC08DRAFT_754094 [Agrocybe pediades]|nr:hypothetical protein CPC08DRAFT_754094 [Agrocybe pediades]
MKSGFTTFVTLFSLWFSASALPSPVVNIHSNAETSIAARAPLKASVIARDEIFDRYFDDNVYRMSQRQYLEATVEPRAFSFQEAGAAVTMAVTLGTQVGNLVNAITDRISKDKQMREGWTRAMVDELKSKYPGFNFVVCHVRHSKQFVGQPQKDWFHAHKEIKVSFGRTIGYDIYWFKEGVFHRLGDGGWLNWAYSGKVSKTAASGAKVIFAAP